MTYNVIRDKEKLIDFIKWLPDLKRGETYYLALHSRDRWAKTFKSDTILRRIFCTKKNMYNEIEKLEVKLGAYKMLMGNSWKDDDIEKTDESLILFIAINPRCLKKAKINIGKELFDNMDNDELNILNTVVSEIYRSIPDRTYYQLDYVGNTEEEIRVLLTKNINMDCVKIIQTKSGYHVLIEFDLIKKKYLHTWYNSIVLNLEVEADNYDAYQNELLLPVPGTTHGGFCPMML